MTEEAKELIEYITLKSNWEKPMHMESIVYLALRLRDSLEQSSNSDFAKCACGGSMIGSLTCIECGDGVDIR